MQARIRAAFEQHPRRGFVPKALQSVSSLDEALPIGYGQTISQPSTVALMLAWLDPKVGDHVLDIGSGSGWTTALLSALVGEQGSIEAVELVPELLRFGEENCRQEGVPNAHFHLAQTVYGWPEAAPYDRILVSAAARSFPEELLEQLRPEGKLVMPVGSEIWEVTKRDKHNQRNIIVHPGFAFVPLIRKS